MQHTPILFRQFQTLLETSTGRNLIVTGCPDEYRSELDNEALYLYRKIDESGNESEVTYLMGQAAFEDGRFVAVPEKPFSMDGFVTVNLNFNCWAAGGGGSSENKHGTFGVGYGGSGFNSHKNDKLPEILTVTVGNQDKIGPVTLASIKSLSEK